MKHKEISHQFNIRHSQSPAQLASRFAFPIGILPAASFRVPLGLDRQTEPGQLLRRGRTALIILRSGTDGPHYQDLGNR